MAGLSIYTVYDNPNDFPGEIIARRFELLDTGAVPTEEFFRGVALDEVRDAVCSWFVANHCFVPTRIERSTDDEPHIVEVWL